MIHNGIAFECHLQNCLARFDLKTKELRGFVIRNLEGVRIHPETLHASTGVKLDCPARGGHNVSDLDHIYRRAYYAGIDNHLQQLIHVLDLHYNDQGWEIVRKHLSQSIPKDDSLYNAWLSPESKMPHKQGFFRSRITRIDRSVSKHLRILIHQMLARSYIYQAR